MSREHFENWQLERDGENILWLAFDARDSSTNVLNAEVLGELEQILGQIEAEPPAGVVIRSAKASGFIAGADVKSFVGLQQPEVAMKLIQRGQALMDRIERLPCPTLALIHGYCLGGGLELALACDYRVVEEGSSTRLALPEVRLGIHPGFGGTVRLPQLVGTLTALELMMSGRPLDARRARAMGLVDAVVPMRHLENAARRMIGRRPPPRRAAWWKRLPDSMVLRPLFYWLMQRQLKRKVREGHYPAPFALLRLWRDFGGRRLQMLQQEARSVAELITGATAQNLVRTFFLQERLKGEGDKGYFNPRHLHVVGGGVMGGDIAAWAALQGMRVTLQDRSPESLARAVARAHKLFKRKLKRPRPIQQAMDRLIPDIHGAGVARADVIIEAIFENIEAKQQLFREIEPRMKAGAILASNTSSIPLETLAEALQQPERLVGIHFFNPVAQMQLVEIVRGAQSSEESLRKAAAFTRHIERLPLPVKSSPGFLINRILMPYLLEAVILESEGVPATAIDEAALAFGMPMGPIHLADTVGLDICLSVAEILGGAFAMEVPQRLRDKVAAGELGVKSGHGFYHYLDGKPQRPEVLLNDPVPADLIDRLMLRLCNEALACLREGVVSDTELLDAGVIFGTGFAPFRGGPINFLEQSGMEEQRHNMEELQQHYGHRFDLDEGWRHPELLHHEHHGQPAH
ncbi:MAG: 3-hydroxyacyl-CoA dehydrogenase NAD-binding domain-containing protein [Chromatiales bacterium]|nr:3-hydroxyacyl-CoA dehydrogenase NAD-binding domain-containing protein [Chromatiales bacterium]